MNKKVLVPLDGSDVAECALFHIRDLAKSNLVGEVTLLRVIQLNFPPWLEGYGEKYDINSIRANAFAQYQHYLSGVKDSLSAEGIQAKTDVIENMGITKENIAEAILEYVKQNGQDLIVLATHGDSGLKRMYLGSVTMGIVNQSNVPIYLIRPDACKI
jgi:nucleotide-binding universal stress UspA family protein